MRLNFFRRKTESKIEILGKEVQSLIDAEFQKVNYKPNNGSPLNQLGMRNGFEIISEFNSEGAYEIAFEHILYMIQETNIMLGKSASELIIELSERMNIPVEHIQNQFNN